MTRRDWNPFLRFPRALLAITALLCLPLLAPLARFGVSAEARALLQGDERNLASFEQVREILGDTEAIVVSLELTNLFSTTGLGLVQQVSDAFAGQPDVLEVKSLTHAVKPVRRGLGFEMIPLVPPGPLDARQLAELEAFCLTHPLVRNLLVSGDGRHTLITVHYAGRTIETPDQERFRERVEVVLAPFRAAGVPLRVLALPLIEDEIRATLRHDLARFVPAAIGVVVLVLWLTFRSGRLVVFALVNQATGLALLPGVIQAAGFELNVFSVVLAPLVTGIHLTLLMHLLTAFQHASAAGNDADAALRSALGVVAKPALLSTLTTVFGLLSLGTSGVESVRDFGWLGALCLGVVHTLTFGPGVALLKLLATRRPWRAPLRPRLAVAPAGREATASADLPERLAQFVERRRRSIRLATALVAGVAVGGLALVRTDVRVLEMLDRRSPTRLALEEIDRAYGGINVVPIEVDSGRTNGLNDPAFLRYLDRVQRYVESRPEPTGVFSYAQLLALVDQIWEGGRPDALHLPESPWLVALFSTAIRAYEFPFLAALADRDFRTAQLVVRTRDLPAADYLRMIRDVVAFAERDLPPGASVSAARGMHSILEADRRILRSQVNSVGAALATIALALAVVWRSVPLALLGVVTSMVPVALTLAVAGYAQVPLNSINVMVGALALGIAQDDTVHFVTYWRDCWRGGQSRAEALRSTLRVKGRPILWTTVILVAVFGLFGFSSFPPVAQFGFLLAGAFVAAQASLLLFLPTWLVGPRDPRSTGRGAETELPPAFP